MSNEAKAAEGVSAEAGASPEIKEAETAEIAAETEKPSEEKFNALITGEYKELFDRKVDEAARAKLAGVSRMNIAEKAARSYERWLGEARETRESHGGFDLSRELKNGQFRGLLKCGVPMKAAYELVHREELMKSYASELEENITKRILAGTLRPKESAIADTGAASVKTDPSRMSRGERQEIIRRVRRGEKITL